MKLRLFATFFLTVLSFNLSMNAQDRGNGSNSSSTHINITDVSMIPVDNHLRCQQAYEAERANLEQTLRDRSIGDGVASYSYVSGTGGGSVGSGSTVSVNGYFKYPKDASSTDAIYYGKDLQKCIDAMVNNKDHKGGIIEFNNSYMFYSGNTTITNGVITTETGKKTEINGYGKVMLKCVKSTATMQWGMLNVAKNKDWSHKVHYDNLPADTVVFSNITIDGGIAWKKDGIDPVLGRGTQIDSDSSSVTTLHSYPLLWISNTRAVIYINNGAIFQNFKSSGSESKGGAINHRRGKLYMYGGAVMDCSVASNPQGPSQIASGAGIYVREAEPIENEQLPSAEFYMYGGSFIGNYSDANVSNYGGGAMYLAGKVRLMGGMIGGMVLTGDSYVRRGNKANQGGGIVVVKGADVAIGGSLMISYNGTSEDVSATYGAGVYVCGNSSESYTNFKMVGGEIANNISGSKGGGLFLSEYSQATLSGGNIVNNAVVNTNTINPTQKASGGGIYVSNNATLILDDESSVNNNSATYNGGGIYADNGAKIELKDCTVTRNICDSTNTTTAIAYNGGGIYYSSNITGSDYVLVNDASGLEAGAKYIIMGYNNSYYRAAGCQLDYENGGKKYKTRKAIDIEAPSNNTIKNIIPAADPTDQTSVYEFTLGVTEINGSTYYTLKDEVNNGYLYASDILETQFLAVTQNIGDSAIWDITFSNNEAKIDAIKDGLLRDEISYYNDNNFGGPFFAGYNNIIKSVYLYKKSISSISNNNITTSDNAKVFGNFAGTNTSQSDNNLYYSSRSSVGAISVNGVLRQNANLHILIPNPQTGDVIARGSTLDPPYTLTLDDSRKIHFDHSTLGTQLDKVNNQVVLAGKKTVNFILNGPLGYDNPAPMMGSIGDTLNLPIPEALSYTSGDPETTKIFTGWGTADNSSIGVMRLPITAETPATLYAVWLKSTYDGLTVYLDNSHTSTGDADVGSISNPATTLATASVLMRINLLKARESSKGKIVIINNPCRIQAKSTYNFANLFGPTKDRVVIQRYTGDVDGYPAYTGDMFYVEDAANFTVQNITVDGGYDGTDETKAHGSIINMSGGYSKMTLGTGVVLRNNYNEYRQSMSDNSGLGGAVHVFSSDTLVMEDGSSIESCFAKSGGGIYAYNATVKMKGGSIGGSTSRGNCATDYGSAIAAFATSTIELTGGVISYNYDGGNLLNGTVYIQDNGSCTLAKDAVTSTTCTVSYNTAKYGGGISAKNVTLSMTEGLVYFNKATTNGGGMYVQDAAIATFEGGYISNNTASRGGGVYICTGGKFTAENADSGLNGAFGQIIQNEALSAGGGVYIEPTTNMSAKGYLYVAGSVVIMTNTKDNIANNVFIPIVDIGNNAIVFKDHLHGYVGLSTEATPTTTKPVLAGVSDELGITLIDTDAENIYSDDSRYAARLDEGTGAIYLELKDIIPGGADNIYLDGVNGSDANDGTSPVAGTAPTGPVKTFDKAKSLVNESSSTIHIVNTVTIKTTGQAWSFNDLSGAKVKRYDGKVGENQVGLPCTDTLIYVKDHGYLTMNGITIDGGNVAGVTSPLICVGDNGVLTMFDGSILQNNLNTTSDGGGIPTGDGGAINIAAGGTVNMYSGCYVRNNTGKNGGGIFMEDQRPVTNNGVTTTKISRLITGEGIEISGNTASGINGCGGGIYCGHGSIDFYGGDITNNHAAGKGGGIYLLPAETSKTTYIASGLHISQNPVVLDNTSGTNNNTDNIYLNKDSGNTSLFISQDDGLETPAHLGISLEGYPEMAANTYRTLVAKADEYNDDMIPEEEAAFFNCDNKKYKTELLDGEIYIVAKEYWKDHVKVKPIEGWSEIENEITVSGYGSTTKLIYRTIHISTPEAMAWLISTVNGLNGQTAYDYAPNGLIGTDATVTINWIYLEDDIDISAYLWTPIGTVDHPFNGYFYGNGHTITGCSVFEEGLDYVGLFGYAPNIMLSDVGLVNSSINGKNYVGGLVGYISPTLTANTGLPPFGRIINSYFRGELTGDDYIGGITGYTKTWVRNCYAIQQMTTNGTHKGSVIGHYAGSSANTDIEYCYGNSALDVVGGVDNNGLTNIRKLDRETTNLKTDINITIGDGGNAITIPFHNITDALNGYVAKLVASGTYTYGGIYPDIYKWKTDNFETYPYHSNEYDYWIDVVKTKADAGIGYVEVYDGTTLKEIHIKSADGLAWLISVVNGRTDVTPNIEPNDLKGVYVYLDDDIDMSGHEFTPIGSQTNPFNGIFAAEDHTIKGIYICNYTGKYGEGGWYSPNTAGSISTGFFGETGEDAIVRNLYLDADCYTTSRTTFLGGIAGTNRGALYNCSCNGLVGGHGNVGGLVGENIGKIHNCYLKIDIIAAPQAVEAVNYFGGIAAVNGGEIKNSYAVMQVDATKLQNTLRGLIAGRNIGRVDYVYLKKLGGTSSINDAYGTNYGNSTNISMFTGTNVLSHQITVTNPTMNMLTALNEYVNEEQIGVYSTWAITDDVNEGYPYFHYDEPFANIPPTVKWNQVVDDNYVATNHLTFAGGSGTTQDPYIIDTKERLAMLAGLVNAEILHYGNIVYSDSTLSRAAFYDKCYKVTKDLDMAEYEWCRIGKGLVTQVLHEEMEDFKDATINSFFKKHDDYTVPTTTGTYDALNSYKSSIGADWGFIYGQTETLATDHYSWCYEFTIPNDVVPGTINVSFRGRIRYDNPSKMRCYVQKKNGSTWESIVQESTATANPWISLKGGILTTTWNTFDVDQFIRENIDPENNNLLYTKFEPGETYRISWMSGHRDATDGYSEMHIDNLKVSYYQEVTDQDIYFAGQIDGDGHFIEGIYINETDNFHGFVGYLKKKPGSTFTPTIKNIGVSSSFIKHLNGANNIGGVVGHNSGCIVHDSYNAGYIYGADRIGGVVGYNDDGGKVYNCYNIGSVIGQKGVGGIVGYNNTGCIVANSYNRGAINAKVKYGGGIMGENDGTLLNVYNAATVIGDSIGGVVGKNASTATAEECYWDIDDAKKGVFEGVINPNGLAFSGSNDSYVFENTQLASFARNGTTSSTKDLIIALNTKVQYSNSDNYTNYKMWSSEPGINDGYPAFSDVYNYSGNVLWYAKYPAATTTDYNLGTASDLKGLAGLNNNYLSDAEQNPYCFYDKEGVIVGYGKVCPQYKTYDSVLCTNFYEKQVNLTENIVFNDGKFLDDGTYITGLTQTSTPAQWEPIGNTDHVFTGTFDGGRRSIKGLYYSSATNNDNDIAGLFGVVSGTLKSIGVEDSYFETSGNGAYIGGICGELTNTTLTKMQDCYYTGFVNATGTGCYAGGLVGYLTTTGGCLYNSYNWAKVKTSASSSYSGGIIGLNNGRIENTYNAGNITAYLHETTNNAGTIAGQNTGVIEKAYYLQMANAQVAGTGSTGTADNTSYFTGKGENCNVNVSSYNYPSLRSTLNAWCGFQTESYDNWVVDKSYPVFMGHGLFWPDMVTTKPEGFAVSGNTITISTKEGLAWLVSVVNGYNGEAGTDLTDNTVVIANNFDMIDYQWVGIGSNDKPFKGKVFGNHKIIANINKNSLREAGDTIVGLFGYVVNAEIRGVVTNNSVYSFVNDKVIIGGVVAKAGGTSKIIGCRSSNVAFVNNHLSWLGGLVGWLQGYSEVVSSSTMCQAAGYHLGGIVYRMEPDTKLINSYSKTVSIDKNPDLEETGHEDNIYQGGLVGYNAGTISNCYYHRNRIQAGNALNGSVKGFLIGKNTGTIEYSYTNNLINGHNGNTYIGDATGGTMTQCGYFIGINDLVNETGVPADDSRRTKQTVQLQNIVTGNLVENVDQGTYVTSGTTTLNKALNGWRDANTTDDNFEWIQASKALNVNYPLLRYTNYEALAAKGEGQLMFYHKNFRDIVEQYNGEDGGGFVAMINNTNLIGYSITNNDNVKVYIKDDVVLLHDEKSTIKATVETFIDNSKAQAREYREPYGDWHLATLSVKDVPIGITYSSEEQVGFGATPNITGVSAAGIIPYKTTEDLAKWDFYTYYEPEYHWINYKRNSASHWHYDEPHNKITYTNDVNMVSGKGYLISFADEQTLLPAGELNNEYVAITVNSEAPRCTGYNLIGNPYQSYLDFKRFANDAGNNNILGGNDAYYIYDNDKPGWLTYKCGATLSSGTDNASQFINMHQGFFIISKQAGESTVAFTNDMRTNETDIKTAFRGSSLINPMPSYPIISILMSDEDSLTENVVVELSRPDAGSGALRLSNVRDGMGSIYVPQDNKDYWVMFMGEVDNIPLCFEAYEKGQFSLEINTENATFSYLHLIDNITGDDVNLLETNRYVFTGNPSDYSHRFRLVFQYIGMEENDEAPVNDKFAYYNNGDLIIDGEGDLQIIDVSGRILFQKHVSGENNRVSLQFLTDGVYILRLLNEDVKTQKILIH